MLTRWPDRRAEAFLGLAGLAGLAGSVSAVAASCHRRPATRWRSRPARGATRCRRNARPGHLRLGDQATSGGARDRGLRSARQPCCRPAAAAVRVTTAARSPRRLPARWYQGHGARKLWQSGTVRGGRAARRRRRRRTSTVKLTGTGAAPANRRLAARCLPDQSCTPRPAAAYVPVTVGHPPARARWCSRPACRPGRRTTPAGGYDLYKGPRRLRDRSTWSAWTAYGSQRRQRVLT